ncbi:hypothetical protein WA026_005221 [Henosepilachna vigintioctopunctata]|uniref:NLGase n=1 Tax=Henosepilachna vigintioctopunctata TaxID=420089 RepID=A0AAW1UMH7_9CUCU
MNRKENDIPNYGLKLKLNHNYPENRRPAVIPNLRAFLSMFWSICRYLVYYLKYWWNGRIVIMDFLKPQRSKQAYGVPIGGIGGGTIGRGYKGEFLRFQMKPGLYEWTTVEANQFIVTIKNEDQETIFHSLLSTFQKKKLESWVSLLDGSKCEYVGLYPRSWTVYDLSEYGIKLICRQVSPVIPHNYKDSSLPCAIFEWTIENVCTNNRTVTIAFTFKSGTGNKTDDKASISHCKAFTFGNSKGVILYHTISGMPCSYVLSAECEDNQNISKCLYFDPESDGLIPWTQLKENGMFDVDPVGQSEVIHGEMACGIAVKTEIKPDTVGIIKNSLVWDMPTINFPMKKKKYYRKYTEFFGRENAALRMAQYAFQNYSVWDKAIYEWQSKVLDDRNLPTWFKTAIFNHLYFVSDGGSIWVTLEEDEAAKLPESDYRKVYGRFAYLEGHEYRMYNTQDVHFYASVALSMNWPHLQKVLQYDLNEIIFKEYPEKIKTLHKGTMMKRKEQYSLPHDMGGPGEEPFILPNAYCLHDVNDWKDLNSKFVLQVFRDAWNALDGSVDDIFLGDMYEACYIATMKLLKFDKDNDGLIENEAKPDQTYDAWPMTGPSAYCGGLWLACLFAMTKISERLNKREDQSKFQNLLKKGIRSFDEKLWNGSYYNFDCSDERYKSIMSDQLCGHWYLRSTGFKHEVFPENNVKSSLKTIYENNVLSVAEGQLGAVNGFIDGGPDYGSIQSREIWTGTTYSLASAMIFEGMIDEGFKTAEGLYNSMTYKHGLAFDYPEALNIEKSYRSIGYMRPLSIWSMLLAYQMNTSGTATENA